MQSRSWLSPGRHWPDRPEIVAGQDTLAGGSWMGVNDHGVMAAVLNRTGSLGPSDDTRSRGELVLDALDYADAADAAEAMSAINPQAYRTFNLVIADNRDVYWLCNRDSESKVEANEVSNGVSIITSQDMNDPDAPRVASFAHRFEVAAPPTPETGDWGEWMTLMGTRAGQLDDAPDEAMCVASGHGFATVSSSLLALPAPGTEEKPIWRFASGQPDRVAYEPVDLSAPIG
jgi:hypothetical protein